jgi:hypothetical protein
MVAWHTHATSRSSGRLDDQTVAALSAVLWVPVRRIEVLVAGLLPSKGMRISEFVGKSNDKLAWLR